MATQEEDLAPAADLRTRPQSPEGTWAVRVTFADGTRNERGLFAFTAEGLLIQTNTGSQTTGIGRWRRTRNGFRFTFREQAFDDDGKFAFDVHVDHEGSLTTGDTFTSNGTGTAVDADGQIVRVSVTTVTAERY
ncbi:hypothetical protein [Amycolatopsis sp. lyj-84]|uniref:hypothetical protein n=1 Tax=Amycolatopsis sp. lyj-84 TaxID=2789284 RepID=UPI00397CCA79